jgi:predicted nucleic acid-binding protein
LRFWDSSAVVPLLVREPSSDATHAIFASDPEILAWWATPIECASALARQERDGDLAADGTSIALSRLDALRSGWVEVQPVDRVRATAVRVLRTHSLRAADALQLAAAIVAAEGHPETLPFVTLDAHLAEAASREGFSVTQPS